MYYLGYDETGYGDYCMKEFESEEEAMKCINENLGSNALEEFRLVYGKEIKLKAIEVTTKVVKA
jgi:hypothetical protein